MPQRIQRKRTKGWRMPEGAVYVGRPSKWGSPYGVGYVVAYRKFGIVVEFTVETARQAVDLYRRWLSNDVTVPRSGFNPEKAALTHADVKRELTGKDLVCWCPYEDAEGKRVPCHADVLLEIANPSVGVN